MNSSIGSSAYLSITHLSSRGPGGRVEITVVTREENVILRVDDSGPGVAPDERSRIFERFHHADSTQGGTDSD